MRPRREPEYRRIADDLTARITAGEYPPGTALPSGAALQASYGVSSTTVRAAVRVLAAGGLVESRQGVGTLVLAAEAAEGHDLAGVSAALDELAARVEELAARVEELKRRV